MTVIPWGSSVDLIRGKGHRGLYSRSRTEKAALRFVSKVRLGSFGAQRSFAKLFRTSFFIIMFGPFIFFDEGLEMGIWIFGGRDEHWTRARLNSIPRESPVLQSAVPRLSEDPTLTTHVS